MEQVLEDDHINTWLFAGSGREGEEESLALGELAQLSITNEADPYNLVQAKVSFRKTWNAKYTLRSHFDGVSLTHSLF